MAFLAAAEGINRSFSKLITLCQIRHRYLCKAIKLPNRFLVLSRYFVAIFVVKLGGRCSCHFGGNGRKTAWRGEKITTKVHRLLKVGSLVHLRTRLLLSVFPTILPILVSVIGSTDFSFTTVILQSCVFCV
jgi:hypothetical protein